MSVTENALGDAYKILGGVYSQKNLYPNFNTYFTNKFQDSEDLFNSKGDTVEIQTEATFRGIAEDTARDELSGSALPVGFTEKTYKLPNHNREDTITSDMLQKRMVGDTPFLNVGGHKTMAEALTFHMRQTSQRHINEIAGSMEFMAIQALLTGKLIFKKNVDMDFGLPAKQNTMPSTTWDNASSDPITDIDEMFLKLEDNSGEEDYEVYLGQFAFNLFINNPKVKDYFQTHLKGFQMPIFDNMGRSSNGNQRLPTISLPSGLSLSIRKYNQSYNEVKENVKCTHRFFDANKVLILGNSTGLLKARGVPSVLPSPVLTKFGASDSDTLVINGGAIVQTILPAEDTGIKIRTRSCQAPIIASCDKIGVLTIA